MFTFQTPLYQAPRNVPSVLQDSHLLDKPDFNQFLHLHVQCLYPGPCILSKPEKCLESDSTDKYSDITDSHLFLAHNVNHLAMVRFLQL
jgi:hypothetical protein